MRITDDSYLKSFIVGSSAPVFFPFFYGVAELLPEKKFDYVGYSFKAPLYFGLANALSLFLQRKFNWNETQRYRWMALLSPVFVATWITAKKAYQFETKERWLQQYLILLAAHGMTWLGTIPFLEEHA